MKRDEILTGVKRLQPWFHCIDLGEGIRTKVKSVSGEQVDHPLNTWRLIKQCLPHDLTGKSLIDVGCNAGFYSVEAKRRGAARVLGVDTVRFHVSQANFVKQVLGLDIEFRRMSVYDLNPHVLGQFDITLALGLIYHCKHLVLALENLWRITKELLIIETAIYPSGELRSFDHAVGGQSRIIHVLGYVENPLDAQESAYNWFLPGVDCLQALLKSIGFDEVTPFAAEDERAVLVCRKRNAYADSRLLGNLAAKVTVENGPTKCHSREDLHFTVRAENIGFATWLARGEEGTAKGAVRLGAHLVKDDAEVLVWDYGRTELAKDIEPGETEQLDIHLRAPESPGKYYIEFDMVVEHLAWLENLGSFVASRALLVEPFSSTESKNLEAIEGK
jgi:tRNA (mo5U34)-methyltransferase